MTAALRIRIGVLAMLSLAGVLTLARVNLGGPNERHHYAPFEFPSGIELPGLQGGQPTGVDELTGSWRAIARARYVCVTSTGELEVLTTYLSSGDGDAFAHATNALELSDVARPPARTRPGPVILRHSGNQVTLTACLFPNGEAATSREEMALIVANRPVTLGRLVSSATGDHPWIDERYLWTAMTITTSPDDTEDPVDLLETAWSEWREYWTRAFPRR